MKLLGALLQIGVELGEGGMIHRIHDGDVGTHFLQSLETLHQAQAVPSFVKGAIEVGSEIVEPSRMIETPRRKLRDRLG